MVNKNHHTKNVIVRSQLDLCEESKADSGSALPGTTERISFVRAATGLRRIRVVLQGVLAPASDTGPQTWNPAVLPGGPHSFCESAARFARSINSIRETTFGLGGARNASICSSL